MDNTQLEVNGWKIYFHPLFADQITFLKDQLQALSIKNPNTYKTTKVAKRLAAIYKLITFDIPAHPNAEQFRQGGTLGQNQKHWFRAKFFQQYRLFYRFDSKSKIIVYVWVNDEMCLRAYDSKTDAYRVFQGMLERGDPPDNFEVLVQQSGGLNIVIDEVD